MLQRSILSFSLNTRPGQELQNELMAFYLLASRAAHCQGHSSQVKHVELHLVAVEKRRASTRLFFVILILEDIPGRYTGMGLQFSF